MNPSRNPMSAPDSRQGGYVLVLVLAVLAALTLLGFRMFGASQVSMKIGGADMEYVQVEMCARRCASLAVNRAAFALENGQALPQGNFPCPCGEGTATQCTTTVARDSSALPRLPCYGRVSTGIDASVGSRCEENEGKRSTMAENVTLREIPIFQFAVFFDDVLELSNGPPMTITGKVHSNSDILIYPVRELHFGDWVTTPERILMRRQFPADAPFTSFAAMGSGEPDTRDPVRPQGDVSTWRELQELAGNWSDWKAQHRVAYGREENGCGRVQRLRLPLRGMADYHDIIEDRAVSDDDNLRRQKFAYKANLTFRNGAWFDALNQPLTAPVFAPGQDPMSESPHPNAVFLGGRVSFWDRRDQIMTRVIPVDVAKLQSRSTGDQIIYLFDESIPDPGGSGQGIGGFLLYNAEVLTRPLTLVTNSRMYVYGDYNSSGDASYVVQPSALVSDCFTQLSTEWDWTAMGVPGAPLEIDARSIRNRLTNRLVGNPNRGNRWRRGTGNSPPLVAAADPVSNDELQWETTHLYACIMSGMVRIDGSQAGQGGYHNFIRFLENWDQLPFIYRGSAVCIYGSQESRRSFDVTAYRPPQRRWSFDPMYNDLARMPPGTPRLIEPVVNDWEMMRQ